VFWSLVDGVCSVRTMLPDSVEPRAKMKVTALQAPLFRSLAVSASWRASSSVVGTGLATARAAKAATRRDRRVIARRGRGGGWRSGLGMRWYPA
jgi:hypothetical protein